MTRLLFALSLTLAVAGVARADIESGPKDGIAVPKLTVDVASGVGLVAGEADVAKVRGDKPTVYAFVTAEKFSRPLAQLLRKLDEKAADVKDAAVVAVWVGGDAAKNKDYLDRVGTSLKLNRTALTASPAEQPEGWALNSDAHVTIVVVVKGKVVKSMPLVSVSEKDATKAIEALTKAVKK
jgi:hypothetical protein